MERHGAKTVRETKYLKKTKEGKKEKSSKDKGNRVAQPK